VALIIWITGINPNTTALTFTSNSGWKDSMNYLLSMYFRTVLKMTFCVIYFRIVAGLSYLGFWIDQKLWPKRNIVFLVVVMVFVTELLSRGLYCKPEN